MKYPDFETYKRLYLKYTNEESVKSFVDKFDILFSGKQVVDLCCGEGIISKICSRRGASCVFMVDQEKDMMPLILEKDNKIIKINESVHSFLSKFYNLCFPFRKIDIVFCRQGINYWFDEESIQHLSQIMVSGGVFIFNTFNTCPPPVPMIKEYEIDGDRFVEISYSLSDGTIHHAQIREGYEPHLTSFKWVSPENFEEILKKYFNIEVKREGKTDYYKCVRK